MNDVFNKHLDRAYDRKTRVAWSKISKLITSSVEQGYMDGQVPEMCRITIIISHKYHHYVIIIEKLCP